MKKIVNIIIAIVLIGTSCGLGYLFLELQDRNDTIDNLEEEIETLESKTASLKKDLEERDYIIKTYETSSDENVIDKNETTKDNQEYSNLIPIDYKDILEKISQKESFILVATMTSCSHCISYKPILNDVLKENNIKAYEIDLQKQELSDRNDFVKEFNVSGTPTTLFFVKGEENKDSKLVGYQEENKIIISLKENHFISE